MGDGKRYFVPNQWGHLLLTEAERVLPSMEYSSLYGMIGPDRVPDNMKKQFPFENVSAIHKAVWDTLGDDGARDYGLRVGNRIVETGLSQFTSVALAAQVAMKVGSMDAKAKIAFEFFSKFYNAVSDEVIVASYDSMHWLWSVTRCSACWNQPASSPACYSAVGIVQGIMHWIEPRSSFRVIERECTAAGGYSCMVSVEKPRLG